MHDLITAKHLDNVAKVTLATAMIVVYGYVIELWTAWYSANPFERYTFYNRLFGPYSGIYWSLLVCNAVIPQVLWSARARRNTTVLFLVAVVVSIGMWLERYVIIVTSLHRDFLPSSWDMYAGTFWDWSTYIGTLGFFLLAMLLFIRFVPMISIFEVRELWHATGEKRAHGDNGDAGVDEA